MGFRLFFGLFLSAALSLSAQTIRASSIAMRGQPRYGDGFTHFDYVNPDAPKGGSLIRHAIGSYDNFHRYALRGNCAAGSEYVYDSLMTGSGDEADALYPLIAESVESCNQYTRGTKVTQVT